MITTFSLYILSKHANTFLSSLYQIEHFLFVWFWLLTKNIIGENGMDGGGCNSYWFILSKVRW